MKVRDRIFVIADLMLGALHSDATITGDEERAVRGMLAELLLCSPDALPEAVDRHVREFSVSTFDVERSAEDFLRDPPMKTRRLLELIASLTDADGTDLREDDYLRDLARRLGMKPEECAGIVLDYETEELRRSAPSIHDGEEITGQRPIPGRRRPPPIPEAARKKAG